MISHALSLVTNCMQTHYSQNLSFENRLIYNRFNSLIASTCYLIGKDIMYWHNLYAIHVSYDKVYVILLPLDMPRAIPYTPASWYSLPTWVPYFWKVNTYEPDNFVNQFWPHSRLQLT